LERESVVASVSDIDDAEESAGHGNLIKVEGAVGSERRIAP
jgi:hypothetical protein